MHAVEVYLHLFIVGSGKFPLTEQALQVSYETVSVCGVCEVRQRYVQVLKLGKCTIL